MDVTPATLPNKKVMRISVVLFLLCQWLLASVAYGAEQVQEVKVADPYIELHTGPGRGYPIFYVVPRGDSVQILLRKTDWFKVRTPKGKEGWVNRDQMVETLQPSGEKLTIAETKLKDAARRRWEAGVLGGDFGGAAVLSLYGAYGFTDTMSVELSVSQVLGDFSDSLMVNVDLIAQPFPDWRVSPYFALGTGVIRTHPRTSLVQTSDHTDQVSHVGIGARVYLTRRFMFRAEYKDYVIFTSRNANEEIREWKAGFAVFF